MKAKMILGSLLTLTLLTTNVNMYAFAQEGEKLSDAELLIQEKFDKTPAEAHDAVISMQNNNMTDEEILNWTQTMEEGTTEEYAQAAKEKMQEQQQDNEAKNSIQSRANLAIGAKGDIIIDARKGSNSSSNSYWSVGHTALVSKDTNYTIESYALDWAPTNRIVGGKAKSGPEMYHNRWGAYKTDVYHLKVKGRNADKSEGAYKYARAQVDANKPYSYEFLNKRRTSHFYCSSLVWRAWYEQGIDVDYITIDPVVTPMEILKSSNTIIQ